MKAGSLARAALLGAAMLVGLSCTDAAPTGPVDVPAPQAGLFDDFDDLLFKPTGLLECSPLPYDSVTQVVGPEGGTIFAGPHRLIVPEGALDSEVAITAVVRPETVNRVEFQPEGLVFNQSASLRMSYANCNLLGSILPKRIAYIAPDLSILDYLSSLDIFWTQTVRGKLEHFSEYAIAW
jgi:hypothetical protein